MNGSECCSCIACWPKTSARGRVVKNKNINHNWHAHHVKTGKQLMLIRTDTKTATEYKPKILYNKLFSINNTQYLYIFYSCAILAHLHS
jgi:hypothetical protein